MPFSPHRIIKVTDIGTNQTIDLEMRSKTHNFVANGIVVGNSHCVAYTVISARCLYLKTHYPAEYLTAVLSCLNTGDHRIGIYINEARRLGIEVKPVDINQSKAKMSLVDGKIYFGLINIKGVGKAADKIEQLQPFSGIEDYLERFGTAKRVGEALIKLGAFDKFCRNRAQLLAYFDAIRSNKKKSAIITLDDFADIEPFQPEEESSFELTYYGLYFNHPINQYIRESGTTIQSAKQMANSDPRPAIIMIDGIISEVVNKTTKRGRPYYIVTIEDETDSLRFIAWNTQYQQNKPLLQVGSAVNIQMVPPMPPYPTWNIAKNSVIKKLRSISDTQPTSDAEFIAAIRSELS